MTRPSQRLELTWFNKDQALIPRARGKYGYLWVDPRDPRYCEVHTFLETDRVEGVQAEKVEGTVYSERADLPPTTDNLLIQGESGDVLEALHYVPELAEQYVGQVKLCYIDPPFNTSKTFIHYEDNLEHSIWLTLMRDRLLHIRALLSDDGSIWVHLDDSENHRMRCLLDEVFGAGNFVAEVVWQKADSPRSDGGGMSVDQDVILVYRKTGHFYANRLPRLAARDALYKSPDGDPERWVSGDPAAPGADRGSRQHPGVYGIQNPVTGEMIFPARGRVWSNEQETVLAMLRETAAYKHAEPNLTLRSQASGIPMEKLREDVMDLVVDGPLLDEADIYAGRVLPRLYFTKGGSGGLKMKKYLSEIAQDRAAQTWWTKEDVGHNRGAKKEIMALFPGQNPFATPKPERLLERVIHIATNPGDIVLDVFAGSGTTAAVAHKMGRRWVTCELVPETVATFTRPRLEKVVRGEDPGGITKTKGERVDATEDGLPEGLTPESAAQLNSLFAKATAGTTLDVDVVKALSATIRQRVKDDETQLTADEAKSLLSLLRKFGKDEAGGTLDLLSEAKKSLGARTKTRDSGDVVNWRGGGGFRVMELSPCVFDYDPELGLVTLTHAAHGDLLRSSVAANLGFTLTPGDEPFHGRKGAMQLVVLDGTATKQTVDDVLAHLPEGELVTIAATGVADGVRAYLRKASPGSVVKHVPDDLFPYSQTPNKG